VSVNGIVIGTVGSNSLAGTKSFTFNANATNALVDEFMQSLTYEFTGTVTPTSVTVDWTFLDAGKLNDTGVTTVNFTPNQLPVVDLNGPLVGDDVSLTYIENEGLTKIAPDAVTFDFNENDITLLNLDAAGFAANTISELAFGGTSVTAGTPSSGTVPIGTSTIAYSYNGVDEFSFTNNAGADEPISTNVLNALIQTIQYQNPSDNPTASSIDFRFTAQDAAGQLSETGTSTVTIVPVNDPPTGMNNPVTIAEDTEYTLLPLDFGFSDVDGDSLNRVFIDQLPVNGQLLFKGNPFAAGDFIHVFDLNQGNLTYQPNVNENGADSFMFSVSDDGGTANGGIDRDQTPRTFTFDVVPVNDVPTTTPVTLTPVAEDSTPRLITQAELLANATDIDGDALTATDLTIASGSGILTDNMDGTWSYTPAANDDTDVSFNYNITDNTDNVASSAALDIMPVNDSPQTASVILTPVAEDSGARIITQAELLANATDTEGNTLTATGLTIAAGNGTLDNNNDGTWIYTPASNDDTGAGFIYTITDGTNNVPGSATLDVLPVNDVPQTTPIILSPTAEDSVRTITQAELLANATDIENDTLTAGNLSITTGNGSLIDNGDGTWNYTPASNDDSDVSFAYIIADAARHYTGQ